MRNRTRLERYRDKESSAIELPISIVMVNFNLTDNLALTLRSAACFGVKNLYVIRSIPHRKDLYSKSGSLSEYYDIKSFKRPSEFLMFARSNGLKIISAEISAESKNLYDYEFPLDKEICIVLGNETTGVPVELARAGEQIYIPMPGVGFCLNTSQAGTAIVSEYCRQYLTSNIF